MSSKPKSDLDHWKPAALALASDELPATNVPFHVLLGEAVDVAKFAKKYWEPELDDKKHVVRRGLVSAVGPKSRLYPKIGQDILSLQSAAQEASTAYLLAVDPAAPADPMARGRFLLDEITATLEWHFDDGVEDENDVQLANLGAAHADDPDSADALAGALDDYAALAELHRDEVDGLGGFEAAFIDEARAVAKTLRDKPATPAAAMSPKAKAALALRNRVIALLADRIAVVRSAARFVFRGQPSIVREATSAYERRRKAALRRAKAKTAAAPKAAGTTTPGNGAATSG